MLEIRVFREPKLPKTHNKLIVGAITLGEQGHYANRCHNPRTRVNQPATATLAPTHGANSVTVATKQNYARGRVNHVAVEEAQEASDVVIGMFLVNDTFAIVLLDSGASHSYISATFVGKHNLPLALLRCQMIVSSPGGICPQGRYARR
jgi:hypothetical protein